MALTVSNLSQTTTMADATARVKQFLLDLQNHICKTIEAEESNAQFKEDAWSHQEGGGGLTRILTGEVIEKGGVNFSHVYGAQLPLAATAKRPELIDAHFEAMGVSVVMHPRNPYAPTAHMNVRLIIVKKPHQEPEWWFGGGFDLTPYYGFEEDCILWHRQAKAACDPFGRDVYSKYKKWCDDYFFLKHRNEPRGIGGIFFDDLNMFGFEKCFAFIQSVGMQFTEAYQTILARRKNYVYTERERNFQLYRRGRYVEFNLLYDRGTLFGLQSNGRTESILMSLPPQVSFVYQFKVDENSPEAKLHKEFLIQKDWLSAILDRQ